jgi:hypothetical protein
VSCSPAVGDGKHAIAVWPAYGSMQVWVDSKRRGLLLGIIRFLDLRFLETRGGFAWDVMHGMFGMH